MSAAASAAPAARTDLWLGGPAPARAAPVRLWRRGDAALVDGDWPAYVLGAGVGGMVLVGFVGGTPPPGVAPRTLVDVRRLVQPANPRALRRKNLDSRVGRPCRDWTAIDLRTLRQLWPANTDEQVGAMLGRPPGQCLRAMLGWWGSSRRKAGGWLTGNDVRQRMGVARATVAGWIRSGALEATRTAVVPGRAARNYRVTEAALRTFVREYPAAYDLGAMAPGPLRDYATREQAADPLLDLKQVARRTGLRRATIYAAICDGRLIAERGTCDPSIRGGRWLVRVSALAAWRRSGTATAANRALAALRARGLLSTAEFAAATGTTPHQVRRAIATGRVHAERVGYHNILGILPPGSASWARRRPPSLSAALLDALRRGPRGLGDLATLLHGRDGPAERNRVSQIVKLLFRRGQIARVAPGVWRRTSAVPPAPARGTVGETLLTLLAAGPMSVSALARALYGHVDDATCLRVRALCGYYVGKGTIARAGRGLYQAAATATGGDA